MDFIDKPNSTKEFYSLATSTRPSASKTLAMF